MTDIKQRHAHANHKPEVDELDLLAVAPQQDTAEAIEAALRDAGHNLRMDWLGKPEELGHYLEDHAPAVICCLAKDNTERLTALCLRLTNGVPVLPVLKNLKPKEVATLLHTGAADVVSLSHTDHLVQVLLREIRRADQNRQHEQTKARLSQIQSRLDALLAESHEARAILAEGIHAELNPVYAALFGFEDAEELLGVPLMDLVTAADREAVKKKLRDTAKGKDNGETIIFVAQKADDNTLPVEMRCRNVVHENEPQIEIQVSQQGASLSASATGLEGRVSLYHALADKQTLLAPERARALFCICIDNLDALQSRLGLPGTDRVLNDVSVFLLDQLQPGDRSFRFSAHEFVILVQRGSEEAFKDEAEALRAAIDEEVFGDQEFSTALSASIAVASLADADDFDQRLLQALKLARSTAAGTGNAVTEETSGERSLSSRESDNKWLNRIKQALAHDQFALTYQNIANLEGAPCGYYDVLLRLIGEQGEHIRAAEFVATAERHNLLPAIDQWVIEQVLKQINETPATESGQLMFVRLSAASMENHEDFLPWLEQLVADQDCDPARLLFSFPEEHLQANMKKTVACVEGLHKLGFAIGISGFGGSKQSLKMLEKLPADFVKLHASHTRELAAGGGADNEQLTRLVEAAHDKGVKIIAEQVEDANTMAQLWQLGVNYIQGNYVDDPVNA